MMVLTIRPSTGEQRIRVVPLCFHSPSGISKAVQVNSVFPHLATTAAAFRFDRRYPAALLATDAQAIRKPSV